MESPLIFVLFLKGKQNKKENLKCDSLFWKRWSVKNRIGFGGQVTYREGTVKKTVAPLQIPKIRSLLIKWGKHGNWLVNWWISNENHNKITEWIWEAKNVPEWWPDLFHRKLRSVNKHRMIMCISWNRINQSCVAIKSINQSIIKSHMSSPHQSPFYFCMNQFQ